MKKLPLLLLLCAALLLVSCTASGGETDTTPAVTGGAETDTAETGAAAGLAEIYSSPLTEDGRYPIRALDYVTLSSLSLTVPADVHTATEDEVAAQIGGILNAFADKEIHLDREVRVGDTVNISYVGTIDGVAFSGGSTGEDGTDVVIGYTSYIDDFLFQLVGARPGDRVEVKVTFPEDYGNEELNGKAAVFDTTVNYILSTPELTDEFVGEKLSGYGVSTAEEFIRFIREDYADSKIRTWIAGQIREGIEVSEVPAALIGHQQDQMISYYREYAQSYGMTLETFLKNYAGMTEEELIAETRPDNESQARYVLVCQAIAELGEIVTDDAAVADYFKAQASYYGSEDYSSFITYYGAPYVRQIVMQNQALDLLVERMIKG
ncbi:MAG: FKBP-type peptidyl-prolyl cis-trans isomerase [Clostridia bacterium]|nr:FKBP-type peptidyl-prolyl cis-trans isomerase [Clostridia bacterium]